MSLDSLGFNQMPKKVYFKFDTEAEAINLDFKDLYKSDQVASDYFSSYLINSSDSTFIIGTQDHSLIMIQEALDENEKWKPIEHWVYSRCGNSFMEPLKLKSGNCVFIPIKKYKGDFKTKFRLKVLIRNEVFYSDHFEGSIYESQFNIREEKNKHPLVFNTYDYLNGNYPFRDKFLDQFFKE